MADRGSLGAKFVVNVAVLALTNCVSVRTNFELDAAVSTVVTCNRIEVSVTSVVSKVLISLLVTRVVILLEPCVIVDG